MFDALSNGSTFFGSPGSFIRYEICGEVLQGFTKREKYEKFCKALQKEKNMRSSARLYKKRKI